MKDFMKKALSDGGEPSSKRVAAFVALFLAFAIFCIALLLGERKGVDFEHYFDSFLWFAAACLAITIPNAFATKQEPPNS